MYCQLLRFVWTILKNDRLIYWYFIKIKKSWELVPSLHNIAMELVSSLHNIAKNKLEMFVKSCTHVGPIYILILTRIFTEASEIVTSNKHQCPYFPFIKSIENEIS